MRRPDISRQELLNIVTEAIFLVSKIKVEPEKFGDNLFHLGLDSLMAIQIVNLIEDRLDIMIDDSYLKRFTSINAIADFFEALKSE